MLASPSSPLNASATMFNCCSTIVAAPAAQATTSATMRRCGEARRRPIASRPLTPVSSCSGLALRTAWRRLIATTSVMQPISVAALINSRLSVPTAWTIVATIVAPAAAQTGAGTDEAEQPLGLPGVVDLVGQRPELADEEEAEDLTEQVKRHGDPLGSCSQQEREDDQEHDDRRLRGGYDVPAGETRGGRRVQCISTPMTNAPASSTCGRLLDPRSAMNLDRVSGLRML